VRLDAENHGSCKEARGVVGEKELARDTLPQALRVLMKFVILVVLLFGFFFSPHRVILEQNVSSAATVLADK